MNLNPEQQKIIAHVTEIWEANPALRFLQLIGNCFGPITPRDIYFVSDDDFQKCLKHTYTRKEKK